VTVAVRLLSRPPPKLTLDQRAERLVRLVPDDDVGVDEQLAEDGERQQAPLSRAALPEQRLRVLQ
jgi:hypothetical protein